MELPPLNSVKGCVKCGNNYTYGSQGGKGDYSPEMEWHKYLDANSCIGRYDMVPCCASLFERAEVRAMNQSKATC
jgi:hypothetical protein